MQEILETHVVLYSVDFCDLIIQGQSLIVRQIIEEFW